MRVHLLFWIILINAVKNGVRNSVFRWSQRRAKQFATAFKGIGTSAACAGPPLVLLPSWVC